ncbi:MAG: glycosyltransferase family 39 protein [Leptolyngbyaceae cyanobacterium bins.59]|nr:glycosyltransferase family 39 protein [Leptolyngbyaceae cyanobacterium bins.59]
MLLVLAVVFRFVNLDRKVYWHDEAFTSMTITARPGKYLSQDLFQNRLVKPADLLAYQQFVPNLTLRDMVVRLGIEDVQHPPLYYILLRFWAQVWGTAPAIIRGFSSLLSLLLFPALYWLCLELFESHLSGWVAIALFSVSPFHLAYGQEAREYGVWAVLTLASSAFLLRAIRFPSGRNWVLYGISMSVSFYTALFSLWIAIGHFLYTLVIDGETRLVIWPLRIGKRTFLCGITLLGVAFSFIPWAFFIVTSKMVLGSTTAWTSLPLPLIITVQSAIFNFSRSLVDFNFQFYETIAYFLAIPVLILQGYAVYVLCRTAPRRIQWFILTFAGITALSLGLPDLLWGGQRFTVTRYLIPCFVGLQLTVVYLLTTYLSEARHWKSRFATLVFPLLILLGVLSCGAYAQANTWWNKALSSNYHEVADLLNGSDRPLIIVDAFAYNPASMISLSYLLKPDTQFLLLPPVGTSFPIKGLPEDAKTIFLFNLPPVFREQFESRYQTRLIPVFQDPWNEGWKQDKFRPATLPVPLSGSKTDAIPAKRPLFLVQSRLEEPAE